MDNRIKASDVLIGNLYGTDENKYRVIISHSKGLFDCKSGNFFDRSDFEHLVPLWNKINDYLYEVDKTFAKFVLKKESVTPMLSKIDYSIVDMLKLQDRCNKIYEQSKEKAEKVVVTAKDIYLCALKPKQFRNSAVRVCIQDEADKNYVIDVTQDITIDKDEFYICEPAFKKVDENTLVLGKTFDLPVKAQRALIKNGKKTDNGYNMSNVTYTIEELKDIKSLIPNYSKDDINYKA